MTTRVDSITSSLPAGRASFSIEEVCKITGLSRATVYKSIAAGELKTRKLGRRTLVLAPELANWLGDAA
jgi:excisionase family DNA binding protein